MPKIVRLLTFVGFLKGVHGYSMRSQNKKRGRFRKGKCTDGPLFFIAFPEPESGAVLINEKTLPV